MRSEDQVERIGAGERYSAFFALAIVATVAFVVFMAGVFWLAFS